TLFRSNLCVTYDLQKDGSATVPLEQASAIADEAFAAWSAVTCEGGGHPSITASNLGPVACGAVEYNKMQPNQNVIVFRDTEWTSSDSASTLGLTHTQANLDTGELVGADME